MKEKFKKKVSKNKATNKNNINNTEVTKNVSNDSIKEEEKKDFAMTTISLDGLSSRSRVLLFRELTAIATKNDIEQLLFSFTSYDKRLFEFKIELNPNLRQPGNGIVEKIGSCFEITEILKTLKPSLQAKISEKLLNSRLENETLTIENPILIIGEKTLDLNMLNILLDFEVARRLQKFSLNDEKHMENFEKIMKNNENSNEIICVASEMHEIYKNFEENISNNTTTLSNASKNQYDNYNRKKLDEVPIGSAIVGLLKISENYKEKKHIDVKVEKNNLTVENLKELNDSMAIVDNLNSLKFELRNEMFNLMCLKIENTKNVDNSKIIATIKEIN
jgi:hypothetical protein